MALAHGYALPFEALRRTGVLSQNTADATNRATADGATKEAAGGCLDARALEVQQRTVVQPSILVVPQLTRNGVVLNQLPNTRTNFIQNNTMVGATGSVRPNLWDLGSLPSGFTVSYSASGQTTAADGTLVDYIDVTVSGTALASGFLNLRQTTSPSPVSGNLLFASGMTYTASVYLALLSGSLTGVATNVMALQEIANTTFVANTTFAPVTGITSELTRFTGTRTIEATGGADRTSVRWGHSIVSGTSYDYTVRIASPQLEKGSVATPVIRTASGFVTVDAGGTARDGAPPDFTFTRATTATRVNASGLIENVASGVLRLDYPITGGCPAALIEASGTNLVLRSEEFNVSGTWTPNDTQILSSNNPAPNGTNTATRIKGNGANRALQQVITGSSGQTYTGSFWVRRVSGTSNPQIRVGDVTGTVSINPTTTWQRFHFSAAPTTTTVRLAFIMVNDTDEFEIWGAQLETGAILTSYIPTTTASATRDADVCSVSGVSGYIGQTQGTLYAEVDIQTLTNTGVFLSISDGTTNNRIQIYKFTNGQIYADRISATQSALTSITTNVLSAGIYKVAFAYDSGNSALFINGVQIGSNATQTFTFGTIDKINIGSRFDNTQIFNDRLRAAAIYTTRLSNDQLESLTRLT